MRGLICLCVGAALMAGPAAARPRLTPDEQLAKALDGRVAGKPVDCIDISRVDSSQIIEGQAILYRDGRTIYVNRPRGGAQSLDDWDILLSKPFAGRLCSIDTVTLLDRSSGFTTGFVFLGEFVPYRKPKAGESD